MHKLYSEESNEDDEDDEDDADVDNNDDEEVDDRVGLEDLLKFEDNEQKSNTPPKK